MTAPRARGASIELRRLAMAYGGVRVLRDVDLRVEAGEFVTFLGPSGSGKTTTLNLIAGFLQPVQGEILLDGRDLTRIPAYQRGIGVVFQSYALFPHMTVAENIAYPLQQRRPRPGREAIARRVDAVLDLVQMRAYADRRPDQLSGGQQQRVALARAVVFEPQLLLLDEPLGALDKRLRESLQGELRRIHRELGVTVVFVTHDQDEALSLSDRIVLFHDGAIEQVGTPEEIYDRPRTAFAAGFLGDSNLFEGRLERGVFSGAAGRFAALPGAPDGPATLMVRPEHVRHRDPLDGASVDVLVIGGGITGAGVALDAAARGLRVALVEQGDFASGTSSRSSKMIHGGFRYLQTGDVALVRESLRERHRLQRNAPHLVGLLPFMIPLFLKGGLINPRLSRALRRPTCLRSRPGASAAPTCSTTCAPTTPASRWPCSPPRPSAARGC
ncbi:FAD-dependent oxidoreductase [Piscinibacter sakaiensis]|uniref:ABC transporter ATP-binding protein n=1 Tax=Piscinibacter sakaiensis TaxID=1547922 RepID=UPI0037277973